jgi:hypothetical protein
MEDYQGACVTPYKFGMKEIIAINERKDDFITMTTKKNTN